MVVGDVLRLECADYSLNEQSQPEQEHEYQKGRFEIQFPLLLVKAVTFAYILDYTFVPLGVVINEA